MVDSVFLDIWEARSSLSVRRGEACMQVANMRGMRIELKKEGSGQMKNPGQHEL
jgi:hypothetical protein